MFSELCLTIWFDYRVLGSSRKLGGAAEHKIYGSEEYICRLSFEFYWKAQYRLRPITNNNQILGIDIDFPRSAVRHWINFPAGSPFQKAQLVSRNSLPSLKQAFLFVFFLF